MRNGSRTSVQDLLPNQAKHNKRAKTASKQFSQNKNGHNDDAKSGKRCKTNGGQTTDQNDIAKSGENTTWYKNHNTKAKPN